VHVVTEWEVHPVAVRATWECLEQTRETLVRNYARPEQRKPMLGEGKSARGELGVFAPAVEMGAMFVRVLIGSPSEKRKRIVAMSGSVRDMSRKWTQLLGGKRSR